MNIGLEIELTELILQLFAFAFVLFGRFEVETSPTLRIIKWFIIYGITIGGYFWVRHWAVLVPLLAMIPGLVLIRLESSECPNQKFALSIFL